MKKILETPELPVNLDEAHVVIKDLLARLERTHTSYEQQIALYQEKIRMLANKIFAAKADSVSSSIFNEVELLCEIEEAKDSGDIPQDDTEASKSRKGSKKPRKIIPDHLPVERMIHDLSDEQKVCGSDGSPLHKIGEEVTRELDYIPAKFRVIEHVTLKYGCRTCTAAPLQARRPLKLIPKSVMSADLLIHVILSKYELHLPLYRQQHEFAKVGVHLSREVMARAIIQVGRACTPLINLMFEDIKQAPAIQCDETPYRVLTVDGVEVSKKSYLWVTARWGPDKKIIVFHHARSRSAHVAKELLSDYEGYLQVDGYSAYDWVHNHPKIKRVGCMAHIRRKFVDFLKTLPSKAQKDHPATAIVRLIKKLYDVEGQAKEQPTADLHQLRQIHSTSVFAELEEAISREKLAVSTASAYGKALSYAQDELPLVKRYLDSAHVKLDNNLVENALRPFCLGKKNWLFAETEDGGEASAALYSLIITAKSNGLDVREYLKRVLTNLPSCDDVKAFEALLPFKSSS